MKEAKVNQDALRRGQKRPVLVSPSPERRRSDWVASPASPVFRLSKCAARQGSRPLPPTAPDPSGLTCLSLGRNGGAWRVAPGTRGLGGCRVPPLLITPPRQSSSVPGVLPPGPPAKASVQPRHPAGYISPLRYSEAAAPLPRGVGGRGGQDLPPRAQAGGTRTGDRGAELTRPQSLLARGLGPDWLAASGKRDLGQTGWHPPHQK